MDTRNGSMTYDRMAYLSAILKTLPDAVAIIDCDHRLVELNPAGLALIGAETIDAIPDRSPLAMVSPESLPTFQEQFLATLSGRRRQCAIPDRSQQPDRHLPDRRMPDGPAGNP